jgi:hypothetical protein
MKTATATKKTMLMNRAKTFLRQPVAAFLLISIGWLGAGFTAGAQNAQHLSVAIPGGMPGLPVVTGVEKRSNSATITWDGPAGYYQLFQKNDLRASQWQTVGGFSLDRKADVAMVPTNAFFRVLGPSPNYAGARVCLECHDAIHNAEMNTRHAGAFTNAAFVAKGGQTNASCLPCHTVGYGLPTGFSSAAVTPHLTGVQCENCHGPAGNHAVNENDPSFRPRAELAATVCGGCHQVSSHPAYPEWKTSRHAVVTEDMNPSGRISSCGRCHSGSSRLALLKGQNPATTVMGDANVPITCVVCHDPHQTTANPYQLRNPMSSTNDYFLSTAENFTNKYNAAINICAQCHNHRGASYTNSSRPPHHSPQYNMLIGTVGEFAAGTAPTIPYHAMMVSNQCVTCHMQTVAEQAGPPAVHAVTGHSFKVESYDACRACHPLPELLHDFVRDYFTNQVQVVKQSLDKWATTKSPLVLRTNYGVRAWEYTNPGSLSNPPGVTNSGPTTAQQSLIPVNIQKARYDLYLLYYDGSFGVHNAQHSAALLENARNWVNIELSK